jgi:hypothetical protein
VSSLRKSGLDNAIKLVDDLICHFPKASTSMCHSSHSSRCDATLHRSCKRPDAEQSGILDVDSTVTRKGISREITSRCVLHSLTPTTSHLATFLSPRRFFHLAKSALVFGQILGSRCRRERLAGCVTPMLILLTPHVKRILPYQQTSYAKPSPALPTSFHGQTLYTTSCR